MGIVQLRAEVLYAGVGCPVCGGSKTEKARTCRSCFESIGFDATMAVDKLVAICAKAAEDNDAAAKGDFRREMVFGSVFAQVKIDKNAALHIALGGFGAYWDCSKSIPGGFVSAYIFGAEQGQRGKIISALVDFKNKEHRPGDVIHYFRAQTTPDIVRSDVKLQIVRQEEVGTLIKTLPVQMIEEGKEKKRKYAVGFQYVNKEIRLAAAEASAG
ncbi:MAG: hypothetical protein HYV53_00060 [Parcubacteria group bacterium]|nr:hypothetical protein [Parcubacteria group bacterium]